MCHFVRLLKAWSRVTCIFFQIKIIPVTVKLPTMSDLAEDFKAFAELKKKKKSKSKTSKPEDLDAAAMFSGKKKKKSKSTTAEKLLEDISALELAEKKGEGEDDEDEKDVVGLTYKDLLDRFFKVISDNNPELAGGRLASVLKIPPPVVTREPKKTVFTNIKQISQKLQRHPGHVTHYLFAELGTSGSVDGKEQLVIKGKFTEKQLEVVLKNYIKEYVSCKTCNLTNTTLVRENANRLSFLVCNSCGSRRSVSSIKTGFQAHVGRRKRMG